MIKTSVGVESFKAVKGGWTTHKEIYPKLKNSSLELGMGYWIDSLLSATSHVTKKQLYSFLVSVNRE